MSDSERLKLAKLSLNTIYIELEKCGVKNGDAGAFIVGTIKFFVSADRSCSKEEYMLINKIYNINISYNDFYNMTNHGADIDFVRTFDALVQTFTSDGKVALCLFGICILSCDGKITVEEQKMFDRILD